MKIPPKPFSHLNKKQELPTIHKYRYDDVPGGTTSLREIEVEIRSYDKNKNQISISDPNGEPYYCIDIGYWHTKKILTNNPEYYFVADSNGDFKKTVIKHRQELGSGDKVIINKALRKFRKNLRRSC
jgi:hypothetical protein